MGNEGKISVNENPYKYLFPFEKVPMHSRILIYGAGTLGQDYLRQMQITGYCEVVAVTDKNYKEYPPMVVPVIAPERIHEFSFDFAVVALRMAASSHEIKRILEREGVAEEKIVCVYERKEPDGIFQELPVATDGIMGEPACSKTAISIAILSTGGLGDMVIQKRFVMELIRLVPECAIDFYNIKAADFLKHLYSDCGNVNSVIPDLGSRYRENYKNYALALTIEACHLIKVDRWERESFMTEKNGAYQEFIRRMDKLKAETEKEDVGISTPMHLTMTRRMYQGLNAYSGFWYNGAFDIRDKKVSIPLDKDWERKFRNLELGRYVTINFGNGDCADDGRIAKAWSKENFEKVIYLIKIKYPELSVVQLGDKNAKRLVGADRHMLGEDFRMAIHVLKHSMLHIDIEGGLVHMATQLGTKCIVLFGPTVKEYYGYEQNVNIQTGSCHGCWGLYPDMNRCARGMEKPECMYFITPEMVLEHMDRIIK